MTRRQLLKRAVGALTALNLVGVFILAFLGEWGPAIFGLLLGLYLFDRVWPRPTPSVRVQMGMFPRRHRVEPGWQHLAFRVSEDIPEQEWIGPEDKP